MSHYWCMWLNVLKDITLCKFKLFELSDKAVCQTKNLLVRFLDLPVDPQDCNAPSLSATAEYCDAAWAGSLCTRLNGHTYCTGTLVFPHLPLFIHSIAPFQPKWEPNITLHLSVCSREILLTIINPSPALPWQPRSWQRVWAPAALSDRLLWRNLLGLGRLCCLVALLESFPP